MYMRVYICLYWYIYIWVYIYAILYLYIYMMYAGNMEHSIANDKNKLRYNTKYIRINNLFYYTQQIYLNT